MPHVMLTAELVTYLEDRNNAEIEGKTAMGELWEVPVDKANYDMLFKAKRPDESWSEVITRLVRESDRLGRVT